MANLLAISRSRVKVRVKRLSNYTPLIEIAPYFNSIDVIKSIIS